MTTKILTLALALGLASFTRLAAAAPGDRLSTFDAHANAALPTTFALPSPGGGEQRISLLEELGAEVEVDGRRAAIFLAEIDGRPGTIVRLGDALDIALDEEAWELPRSGYAIDRESDAPSTAPAPPGAARKAAQTNAVDVRIFLHDESGESDRAKFLNWYVVWWLKDMQENVTPGAPVRVSVHEHVPGLTDLDYHVGTIEDRIRDVARRGREFMGSWGDRVTPLTEYVLFVGSAGSTWKPGVVGGAVELAGAAIASRQGPRHVVAHELGHLLGARHEDAQRDLFCVTNMKDDTLTAGACKRYSDANKERIRRYVSRRSGD